jgi:hypothetical protein
MEYPPDDGGRLSNTDDVVVPPTVSPTFGGRREVERKEGG